MNRPTFYTLDRQPIRAGGILLYRFSTELEFLMIRNTEQRYEDIGGKTDIGDKTIENTIIREAFEETNGLLNPVIPVGTASRYFANGKYFLYLVKANSYERQLTSEQFGTVEIHDGINRTIHWVPQKSLANLDIHPRLHTTDLLAFIPLVRPDLLVRPGLLVRPDLLRLEEASNAHTLP